MSVSDTPSELNQQINIHFHFEEVDLPLSNLASLQEWIKEVIIKEDCTLVLINFIFCTDNFLHQINLDYLQHDTLTDIITFPYSPPPQIEGDIFISLDRVRENSQTFNVPFLNELYRVMSHGTLHLCGYFDKTPDQKKLMTQKEDEALALFEKTYG